MIGRDVQEALCSTDGMDLPDDLEPFCRFRAHYQGFKTTSTGEGLITFAVPLSDKVRAMAVSDLPGVLGLIEFSVRNRAADDG